MPKFIVTVAYQSDADYTALLIEAEDIEEAVHLGYNAAVEQGYPVLDVVDAEEIDEEN